MLSDEDSKEAYNEELYWQLQREEISTGKSANVKKSKGADVDVKSARSEESEDKQWMWEGENDPPAVEIRERIPRPYGGMR